MTSRYRLTKRARDDLKAIYIYGREKFGRVDAANYVASIKVALELIADQPRIGTVQTEIKPEVRMYPHGSHIILYCVVSGSITILRIMSGKAAWQRLLSGWEPRV